MVLAHHLIWTAYGWWLPNDPRGSNSYEVRVAPIAELGELHHGRKRVQPAGVVIREFYAEAADRLKHPLLRFDTSQFAIIADAIADIIHTRGYSCVVCAIMPDHVHLVVRRHHDRAEEMIDQFQQHSRNAAITAGLQALTHPVWGGPGWKVFLNTPHHVRRVIEYVRLNPIKARLPEQDWDFVTPYDETER